MIKKLCFLLVLTGTLAAQNLETIDHLLLFAHNDLANLEKQWLSIENKLISQLEETTNDLIKQKLLSDFQARQEAIEREIEEVERLIEQLKRDKEFLLNPPPEPIIEEEIEPVQEEAPVVMPQKPKVSSIRREINKNKETIKKLQQEFSRGRSTCPPTDPCAQTPSCVQRTTESPPTPRTKLTQRQDPRFRCDREAQQAPERTFLNGKPTNSRRRRFCLPAPPPPRESCCPLGIYRGKVFRTPMT